ncbi:MAG: tRNA pseudouridine(55) synthase TruB [Puniceicoccales bacterium]|jgi:tRNA pseudouridine55 synthase|nr:tRNA pseudouridine(55) synthase TruB [Puniceicoccales bacterium]
MNGILLVDKPIGWTSHDVVAKLRSKLGIRKIGHGGTLDPMATGLLILLIGKGTKISQYITNQDKTYQGKFCLGQETDSYDREGNIIATYEICVSEKEIRDYADQFLGEQFQLPPMFSAKKIKGQPLYKLARQGEIVERKPHSVNIYEFSIHEVALPYVAFTLDCSKGTYVRTLAHDFGKKLGCGAYLFQLCRTRTGNLQLNQAVSLEKLLAMSYDEIEYCLLPITDIL